MRLVTFRPPTGGKPRAGAVIGESVVDLTASLGVESVRELLASGRLAEAREHVRGHSDGLALGDVHLDLPMTDPQKIFCVGVNYMNRNEEYRDNSAAPAYPSLFMRNPLSFVPHGGSLLIPPESDQFDYEGEIVLVIGRPGRRITQEDAHDHIAGLTIMNEGSVRDWLRHGKFNVTQGKNFDA
ncbi:MAG: fumarylacetoacetate hydrolase family protein, partial [Geminicoccaceae bacterium]